MRPRLKPRGTWKRKPRSTGSGRLGLEHSFEEEEGGDHGEDDGGHQEVLAEGANAFAGGSELDYGVEREVAGGDGYDCAVHAVVGVGDVDGDDDEEAVTGVADGAVLGFAEGHQDGVGGLVEERVPEAEGEDGDHPGAFGVAVVVELEDEEIAPGEHDADYGRAQEEDVEAVAEELGAELGQGLLDDLGDEGVEDALAEGEDDLAGDVR